MTTRAGLAGLISGLITTIMIYPLFISWPEAFLYQWPAGSAYPAWIAFALISLLMIGGGALAGRWSGTAHPLRRAALGALAGGLAGTILFCLWGAASAGSANWISPIANASDGSITQVEITATIVRQTMGTFLVLFVGGVNLGALGGWLTGPGRRNEKEEFHKTEPQMAMNASITAVPASIVATAIAAFAFLRLSAILGGQENIILELPLAISLLLVLLSQFALTLVIPHETRQAEHRCGLDEVKMAAYVDIGTAPLLTLLLFLINARLISSPLVLAALMLSAAMSLKSLQVLLTQVLPRRAAFPAPREDHLKTEAKLFGTISKSRGSTLVVLCTGCGLVMVLPIYISIISVMINLNHVVAGSAITRVTPVVNWRLYLTQALVSTGVITASIILLITIYLFYLNLGRWFSKQNSHH
jgi:hypothetical protein